MGTYIRAGMHAYIQTDRLYICTYRLYTDYIHTNKTYMHACDEHIHASDEHIHACDADIHAHLDADLTHAHTYVPSHRATSRHTYLATCMHACLPTSTCLHKHIREYLHSSKIEYTYRPTYLGMHALTCMQTWMPTQTNACMPADVHVNEAWSTFKYKNHSEGMVRNH